MATSVPDSYVVPSGATSVRGGNGTAAPPDPVWLGDAANAFSINAVSGQADFRLLSVSLPSTFSVTPGYSLPSGVTLTTVSSTQCRLDFSTGVPSGTYQFRIRATPL